MGLKKRCACRGTDGKQLGAKCELLKRPDGSWNPRHGKWGYSTQVFVPGHGMKQHQRTGWETRAEAQAAMDAVRAQQSRGIDVRRDQVTLKDYMTSWLDIRADELAPATMNVYRGYARRVWIPHLGHMKVADIRAGHVAGVLKETTKEGSTTRVRVRAMISSCLSDAVSEGLCPTNPASGKLVRIRNTRRPTPVVWTAEREARWRETGEKPSRVNVWTPEHLSKLLDAEWDSPWFAVWWLLSHRGLRRGELLALRWHNVDLHTGVVRIELQRTRAGATVYERPPKSAAGNRTIALGREGIQVMRRHRKQQMARGHAGSSYVFTNSLGDPFDPQVVSKKWRKLCVQLDLPACRLHDLRHLTASLLVSGGASMKVVQETLGHSNFQLTANTYVSILPDLAFASADLVTTVVPRGNRPSLTHDTTG